MGIMLDSWQNNTLEHSWVMPDNFHVKKKVLQAITSKITIDELDGASFIYQHTVNKGYEDGLANAADISNCVIH